MECATLTPMLKIQEERQRAGLSGAEVAQAIGRNATWLSHMEVGVTRLQPEQEKAILTAISRLEKFNRSIEEAKARLTADLKLPPTPPTRGRPHPGGTHAA